MSGKAEAIALKSFSAGKLEAYTVSPIVPKRLRLSMTSWPGSGHHLPPVAGMDVGGKGASRSSLRSRAAGMVEAGMSQTDVAQKLGISRRTVNKWWRRVSEGEPMSDKPRSGRPPRISRVAKIVCAKAAGKRGQSVRKLAKRLTRKGHGLSKPAVHRYVTKALGLERRTPSKGPSSRKSRKTSANTGCASAKLCKTGRRKTSRGWFGAMSLSLKFCTPLTRRTIGYGPRKRRMFLQEQRRSNRRRSWCGKQ